MSLAWQPCTLSRQGHLARSYYLATSTPNATIRPTIPLSTRSVGKADSSTFARNMGLPIHRWYRFSAGFSAAWVESVLQDSSAATRVFDPFAGSATTILASERVGANARGIDAHPFVCRIAKAKLAWRSDPQEYRERAIHIRNLAGTFQGDPNRYPKLIRACYHDEALRHLDCLRRAYEATADNTPDSELAWLTLISILRRVSTVGTAPWQYVLPRRQHAGVIPCVRSTRLARSSMTT